LLEQIDSEFCEILIVENSLGKPVGQIRLEYDQQHATARLNVGLVPSLRGMGLGTAMIERACRDATVRRPNLEVYANIRTNNVISQAAFRKAGFSPDATLMVNGNVAVRFSIRRFDAHRVDSDLRHRKAS
jgi:RimJ/RimL family protein N-acetyltransferase